MAKFVTKKGDTGIPLIAVLKDSHGAAIDLTDWTVTLTMTLEGGSVPKINQASCTILPNQSTTGKGKVQYDWQAADVDTIGTYNIEFKGTMPNDGGIVTFPRGIGATQFGKVYIEAGLS